MTLTKKAKLVYRPAVAGDPGDPGAPATPGYYAPAPSVGSRWALVFEGRVINTSNAVDKPQALVIDAYTDSSVSPPVLRPGPAPGQTRPGAQWVAIPPSSGQVYIPPVPGRPSRPATQGSPAKTQTTFNLGWNAGAISSATRDGDLTLQLQVSPAAVGIVAGLNDQYEANNYRAINHAFYFASGKALVYENGVQKTTPSPFAGADVFEIRRAGGVVSYYQGAVLLHTSAASSAGPVFADSAMYSSGDAITLAKFTAGEKVSAGTTLNATASTTMQAVIGNAFDNAVGYAEGRSRLAAIQTQSFDSDQELRPDFALAESALLPIQGFALMLSGAVAESAGTLASIQSVSSDGSYAEVRSTLSTIQSLAMQASPVGNHAFLLSPPATLRAEGHNSTAERRANLALPFPDMQANGGASAGLVAPSPTISASVTLSGWGRAELEAPAATLVAHASTNHTAYAALTPNLEYLVAGYAGAVCSITIGAATLVATGTWRQPSSTALTLPLFELRAHASAYIPGRAALEMPAPRLINLSVAWLMAPGATLQAIGSAVVAATYEAYSINLSHTPKPGVDPTDEVTRYTNFPFTHIVRYQGSYFGVAGDGLYLLEGATDDGVATPYALKTGTDDFGTPQLKTVAAAYFGGRLGPSATVMLHAGETGAESYSYTTPRDQAAQSHREKFGRGVKSRYFALGLAGEDALELDSIELEINTMKRRI